MDQDKLDRLLKSIQALGYEVKQSPSTIACWYAVKPHLELLFALIYTTEQGWTVRDISGKGAIEKARLEREVAAQWQ